MIDTDKYEGLTIDDWYKMNHHDWKDVVNEHNDLLAEVKRLRRAFHIATAHIGYGNHLGHAELRRALNSVGIDHNSLPWADGEWVEPLPTFGGVAHYD